jgi:ribose 5-phosphate isomerase B
MIIMRLRDRTTCYALAWELIQTFLKASFKGTDRFKRRLDKIKALEKQEKPT